jgi:hypothetical protein
MLNAEQRLAIIEALVPYGARLTEDNRIAKGEKVMSVELSVKGKRLHVTSGGTSLASYPASKLANGVSDFVEKFWFWKKS